MSRNIRASQIAAIGVAVLWSASATAETDPRGIWYDHNGRGAVEIKDCKKSKGLCGFVVHVKEKKHEDRCGTQILGSVTSKGGGWIYSPARGKKYSVRLTRLSDSKLRVVGNASSSFFSKTFTWERAPDDVQLCGKYAAAKRNTAVSKVEPAAEAEAAPERKVERKIQRKTEPKIERDVVRRAERDIIEPPPRFEKRSTVAEEEEAELERNATTEKEETNRDDGYVSKEKEDEATGQQEYGAIEEEEEGGKTVENDVTQVFDELIDKANEYTGDLKRKCKFRIPYVDKVVMIPCRD